MEVSKRVMSGPPAISWTATLTLSPATYHVAGRNRVLPSAFPQPYGVMTLDSSIEQVMSYISARKKLGVTRLVARGALCGSHAASPQSIAQRGI